MPVHSDISLKTHFIGSFGIFCIYKLFFCKSLNIVADKISSYCNYVFSDVLSKIALRQHGLIP